MSKESLSFDERRLPEVQVADMTILYLKCPAFLFSSPLSLNLRVTGTTGNTVTVGAAVVPLNEMSLPSQSLFQRSAPRKGDLGRNSKWGSLWEMEAE